MADEEQLRILNQGVAAWNAWRRKARPEWLVDLIAADLRAANLRGADFSGANFSGAKLIGADLSEANLSGARLIGADLNEANLSGARLIGADLNEADLSGTNLSGANLSGANLSKTKLIRANLSRANLIEANLAGADLPDADLRRANLFKANLIGADLSWAKLEKADLTGADLSEADLSGAKLIGADLSEADLRGARLIGADLNEADLSGTNLSGADLSRANLSKTKLIRANLSGARLIEADLKLASLVGATLTNAILSGCRIYGISAWDLRLKGAFQQDLIITDDGKPAITTDDLEVAQFIYLLLHNEKIRNVIDTIGKKAVLILGRFTPERKAVLDGLRDELRRLDYLPILFDFDKPASRDLTATVSTLAHLARFIIADLTGPSSIPLELATVVPLTPVPVQPILLSGKKEFAMFADLRRRYRWVLKTHTYKAQSQLIANLSKRVIRPAEDMVLKLQRPKRAARLAKKIKPRQPPQQQSKHNRRYGKSGGLAQGQPPDRAGP